MSAAPAAPAAPQAQAPQQSSRYQLDPLTAARMGLLGGLYNSAASLANTPSMLAELVTGKKFHQAPYVKVNEIPESLNPYQGTTGTSEFLGSLAGPGAAAAREAGLLTRAARGGAAGFATSGTGDESDLLNRSIGAGVGAGLPVAGQVASGVYHGVASKFGKPIENELEKIFAPVAKSTAIKNVSSALEKAHEALSTHFTNTYNEIRHSYGSEPVKNPISATESNRYSREIARTSNKGNPSSIPLKSPFNINIPGIPKHGPSKIELSIINPETGKDFNLDIPQPKNGKPPVVQQYMDLSRDARNAKLEISRELSDPNNSTSMTMAEKNSKIKQIKHLQSLQDLADRKIKESIPEESAEHYAKTQEEYKNWMVPFKTSAPLRKAVTEGPGQRIAPGIFEELIQTGNQPLLEKLKGMPEFRAAILQHQVRGGKRPVKETFEKTEKAFKNFKTEHEDLYNLLTPKQKADIEASLSKGTKREAHKEKASRAYQDLKKLVLPGFGLGAGTTLARSLYKKAQEL